MNVRNDDRVCVHMSAGDKMDITGMNVNMYLSCKITLIVFKKKMTVVMNVRD